MCVLLPSGETRNYISAQKEQSRLRDRSTLSVFVPMAEKKIPKNNIPSDQLSDSNTPDEEPDLRLHISEEERNYGMLRGSAQATQAALSHSRVQTNPTVERGPPRRPKIKKLPRVKAAEKDTQTKDKEKKM